MADYTYTKTTDLISPVKLRYEVEQRGPGQTLTCLKWESPDELTITFDASLSAGDKTTLDNTVDTHSPGPLLHYRYNCPTHGHYIVYDGLSKVTECITDSDATITDVAQQDVGKLSTDESGVEWELLTLPNGDAVSAERV